MDAHVPGPGLSRPIPKKVPISQAHRLCGSSAVSVALVFMVSLRLRTRFDFFQHLRIENRRADAIAAASPLAQVDQSAAIAAEREVRIGAKHKRSARGTAEAKSFLSRHTLFEIHIKGCARPDRSRALQLFHNDRTRLL